MPTTFWTGNGQNIAQVDTLTVTAVAVSGTLTATINSKSITYTCVTGDTTSTAAAAWQALLAASTAPPEFNEITWTVSGAVVTATAATPGTPFTLSKSQSGGATCTQAHPTVNSSQNDVNNAANWLRSGSQSLPQNDDDVVVANSSVSLLWNLDQLASVRFATFTRWQSFTGTIGLPENNPLGYWEYRPTYFQFTGPNTGVPLVVALGVGSGSGPSRERYNVGSVRTNLSQIATGSPTDAYSVRFLGTHANNTIKVLSGSLGVAMLAGETSTIDVATVAQGGSLDVGAGVTFTGTGGGGTCTFSGGSGSLFCAPATLVVRNGARISLSGSGSTYASVTANDASSISLTRDMTITSLTLARSSLLDNSGNLGAVTITNTTVDATCQVLDPNSTITWTNAATVNGQVQSGPFQFAGPRTVKVT